MSCFTNVTGLNEIVLCVLQTALFHNTALMALAIITVYALLMWKLGMPKTVGLFGGILLLGAFRVIPELELFSNIGLMVGGALFVLSIIFISRE